MTSNTQIIRDFYESYNRKDLTPLDKVLSLEIEIYQTDELPWGGQFRGLSGVQEFMAKLVSHLDSTFETAKIFAAGNRVVVSGRTAGTAKATGKHFAVDAVHIWTLDADKVVRFEVYIDTPEMMKILSVGKN